MGLIIGNRALQGSPMVSYLQDQELAGSDVYVSAVFLDKNRVPVTPTSIKVELDDLSNSLSMDGGPNTLSAAGATTANYIYPAFTSGGNGAPWILQLTASLMQMSYPYQGSQICKLKMVFTAADSVTSNPFTKTIETIFELVSTPTVSGAL